MFRGLYAAATGLDAAAQAQEVTAENLANVTTPGYRQRGVTFETFDRALDRAVPPAGDYVGTRLDRVYHDFRPGPMQQTGAPLDVAIADGDKFFSVNGPDGRLLTRNGTFKLNDQGVLVTQGGYTVQGDNGPISVPRGTATIHVSSDGGVSADGVPVGRLRLVRVADTSQLTAVSPTLYRIGDEAGAFATDGRVVQGHREGSNVNPSEAMIRMIIGNRYYEAAQRALRTIAESVQLNTRPTT
jgi:flagellar basal-body rod protein FlgF